MVSQELQRLTRGISVQGLLAIDLILDNSNACCRWKTFLPDQSSFEQAFPYWWDRSVQRLLPEAAMKLLTGQQEKLSSDWSIVALTFPSLSREKYAYYWFTVGTRTFYYTDSASDYKKDPGECLALLPFADLFNHSSRGCEVTFSDEAYSFTTKHRIFAGEEIFINYGEHSNDFLLAECGFVLENNEHDTVALDLVLLNLFDNKHKEELEKHSFWAGYVLGTDYICYRTEVAVRLLCMPYDVWQRSLKEGFATDDKYRPAIDNILQKSLQRYSAVARHTTQKILELPSLYSTQQAVLKRRWEEILLMLDHTLLALHQKASGAA